MTLLFLNIECFCSENTSRGIAHTEGAPVNPPLAPILPQRCSWSECEQLFKRGVKSLCLTLVHRNSQSQSIRKSVPPLVLIQTMISNADMTGTRRSPKSQSWEVVAPTLKPEPLSPQKFAEIGDWVLLTFCGVWIHC